MAAEGIPEAIQLRQYSSQRSISPDREIYLGNNSMITRKALSIDYDSSFDRLTSFGNFQFDQHVNSKGLGYIKKVIDSNPILLHLWNEVLVMLCVVATSLDPLFCYILIVDEGRDCVSYDYVWRKVAVVLRSITDFLYIILIAFHFQFGYSVYNAADDDSVWVKAWKIFLSYFTVDLLAVLPLPQVVVLFIIPKLKRVPFVMAIRSLKYILLAQYLPRVFRIYTFLKKARWSASILPESAGAKAAFNLFLYLLASHVIGAFWYLFSIERKVTCWKQQCLNCSLNCIFHPNNVTFDSFCSSQAERGSKGGFDFGIFDDAIRSRIINSTEFIKKLSYCFWWGLQKLSSMGQDLKTSDHLWEIYFSVAITIFGVILFALLVGNLQTYLQSTIARLEEMRLKGQDIELWMAYHSLPRQLKKRIKKYERYKWRETRGVNVEKLLLNLPKDLRRDTKRHLCSDPISKVSMLPNMDGKFLEAICDYLKPVLYIERNFIIQEGEPLDEMIFITRGEVLVYSNSKKDSVSSGDSPSTTWLSKGDFYGTELLDAALLNPSSFTVPKSLKTIRAHSKVEAFVLMANDLKIVINKFWWLFSKNSSQSTRVKWAPWAALVLQKAWRRHCKKKREEEEEEETSRNNNNNKLNDTVRKSVLVVRAFRALKTKHEIKNQMGDDANSSESSRV